MLIASFFRQAGGIILYGFLPAFFVSTYPENKIEYSELNAFVLVFFGITSSILEGLIADRFSSKTPWTNPLINIA